MTPKETLDELERSQRRQNFMTRAELLQLLADARNLMELVEALPKCCDGDGCDQIATHLAIDEDGGKHYGCDDATHSTVVKSLELPYAGVVRRIEK